MSLDGPNVMFVIQVVALAVRLGASCDRRKRDKRVGRGFSISQTSLNLLLSRGSALCSKLVLNFN